MVDVVMIGPFPENPLFIKGGVQASVYGLARALKKQDAIDSVSVISIPIKSAESTIKTATVEGIEVTYLNAPYKYVTSAVIHIPMAIRAIKARNNPIVHVHGTGLFQAITLTFMRLKRIPFVWTLHGITPKETLQRFREKRSLATLSRYIFYSAVEGFLLRITPDIIVDTPYVETEIRPNKNTIDVIPQGIFTEEFTELQNATRDQPVLISLGVLTPRKGHHLTLEAFARVKEKIPAARLIIAGSPTSPSYYELLKKRVAELGLENSVEIAVNRPRQEIIAMLGSARLFVLHSQEESQGIALCEALAAGLPIIATNVGGIPFVVQDQRDGFLVPFNDVTGFAGCIIRLLTDQRLYTIMAAQTRTSAKRFDWNTIAATVIKTYSRAIGRTKQS